jgi:hypothetical protein
MYFFLSSSSNLACFSVSDRDSTSLAACGLVGGVGGTKALSVVLLFDNCAGEKLSLFSVCGLISVDELMPRSLVF